ncbi:hypothetical protein SMACR_06161 [Sordaria macrospora]|uniref:WGS project CABT00000000 data, contig 2.33 n=2 Tax=Sordaria macrospora TaxID=5147 RepID=F7W680_SORMK|nr:uncharacterized protein SMAC_06161 [Sordaria macrospora k-hell]KAA8633396.1 hypothetical protein SMACR_06161 [Sordaria macrospora]WPJ66979.1 hypothetical protein SMAC4_06161 [Sordaria macrospora]CCC13018.1 unnamed protein product [Sordaria macrospora k-hell]
MCGRYAINLRPSEVRRMLQADNMPVDDAPDNEGDDSPRQSYNFAPGYRGVVYRARVGGGSRGAGGRRRAAHDASSSAQDSEEGTEAEPEMEVEHEEEHDHSEAPEAENEHEEPVEQEHEEEQTQPTTDQSQQQQQQEQDGKSKVGDCQFILQPMKWGLIPSWTFKSKSKSKFQKPASTNYTTTLKTINCRDDSLLSSSGIWSSIKHRHRCIIPAQGFFEWLNTPGTFSKGGVEKIPHFVKRKDGKLMLFAGLYDCAHFTDPETGEEGEVWSYTIITTSSNEQLRFLHDRMPVILEPRSDALRKWLDPERNTWGEKLQGVLKPFEGELEVYPVDKRVGKVGNDGEDLIVPKEVRREERDIGSWFGGGGGGKGKGSKEEVKNEEKKEKGLKKEKGKKEKDEAEADAEVEVKLDTGKIKTESVDELMEEAGQEEEKEVRGIKREASSEPGDDEQPPAKKSTGTGTKSSPLKGSQSQNKPPPPTPTKTKGKPISATKNKGKGSPIKHKNAPPPGMQKITKFFGNSA